MVEVRWGCQEEYLSRHLFEPEHGGLEDVKVQIIDPVHAKDPTNREGFWTHKVNTVESQK